MDDSRERSEKIPRPPQEVFRSRTLPIHRITKKKRLSQKGSFFLLPKVFNDDEREAGRVPPCCGNVSFFKTYRQHSGSGHSLQYCLQERLVAVSLRSGRQYFHFCPSRIALSVLLFVLPMTLSLTKSARRPERAVYVSDGWSRKAKPIESVR